MSGPIFRWELRWTLGARWFLSVRVLYALTMLSLFLASLADLHHLFQLNDVHSLRLIPSVRPYEYGRSMMLVHFGTVFMIAPVVGSGPILRAKKQQTLELLLTTHLGPGAIIGQYWHAAWVKVVILTAPGIPLLFALSALLNAPWWQGLAWICAVWLVAMPLVAWSLTVATLVRGTFASLLGSYAGNLILIAILPAIFCETNLESWLQTANEPAFWFRVMAIGTAPTAIFLLIAARLLRHYRGAVVEAAAVRSARRSTMEVGDEPWYWKQAHLHAAHLPRFVRVVPTWCRVAALILLACVLTSTVPDTDLVGATLAAAVLLGAPLAALLSASVVISSEREANTWDCLRLSPILAEEFFEQTLNAIKARTRNYWLALLPAVVCLAIRRLDWGVAVFLFWVMGGGGIHHAAVVGWLFSARMSSSWTSTLIAATVYFAAGFFIASSCYVIGLMIALPAILFSPHLYYFTALGLSLAPNYVIFQLITIRLERATIRYLIEHERLYSRPLATMFLDDSLFR